MNLSSYRLQVVRSGRRPSRFGTMVRGLLAGLAWLMATGLPAAPALAAITNVTVAVSPATAGATAQYDVHFTGAALALGPDTITVTFPVGTVVPASIPAGQILVTTDNSCTLGTPTGGPVSPVGQVVTFNTPVATTTSPVCVRFHPAAGIVNPATGGSYSLTVNTSVDTAPVSSAPYAITGAAGALQGSITIAAPGVVSLILSTSSVVFGSCQSNTSAPTTGLTTPNGTCSTPQFSVTALSNTPVTVQAKGSDALPPPSTGSGWTLCQINTSVGTPPCTGPDIVAATSKNPGTDQFVEKLTSTSPIELTTSFQNVPNLINVTNTTISETLSIVGPEVSSPGASSNPGAGFTTTVSWLAL